MGKAHLLTRSLSHSRVQILKNHIRHSQFVIRHSPLAPDFRNLTIPTVPAAAQTHFSHRLRGWGLRLAGAWLSRRAPAPSDARKILLIRPDHLGDLLFLTPALRHLRQSLPEAHLTLLVGKWGLPIVRHNPHVDEILTCDFPGFTRTEKPSPWQPYRYLSEQARALKPHRFDTALVLRFDHWWGAWLAAAAGIPRRIGYAIDSVRPFLTHPLPYIDQRHEVEQNFRLAQFAITGNDALSPNNPIGDTEFFPDTASAVWAKDWLRAKNVDDAHPLVVIHPGAGAAVKLWRAEAWAQVMDALAREFSAQFVLSGSPAERALCAEIAEKSAAQTAIAAGETSLSQIAAIMARTALVIGPDTGPVKLAAAVGAPTLSLYGPVDAVKFGTWGNPRRHRILLAGLACQPCNRLDFPAAETDAHFCVRGLSAAGVIAAAVEMMGNGDTHSPQNVV